MVVVPKKNGTLHICLYPQDLNHAIWHEHYPLPTIEDVATRLHGVEVFTVLNVRKGFWHVELDEPSSFLTTFHTQIQMEKNAIRNVFSIGSLPMRMHGRIEGLQGVTVILRMIWKHTG